MTDKPAPAKLSLPVVIVVVILVVTAAFFLIALVSFSNTPGEEPLSEVDIEARAVALAAMGNAANGEALVTGALGCAACHIIGAENGIAPPFAGIADVAEDIHPTLSATAYLYESIINPAAFIVEGFQNAMPANYPERMTDQQVADVLAYLLAQRAQ
jgi:mono/diheme cytochrome c family protein